MKLDDISEMTMRTGSSMETMPFPDFSQFELTFEGHIQGGQEVYSFNYQNTIIYGIKQNDIFVSFVQLKNRNIPNIGNVAETLNSKTLPEYRKNNLTIKLRFFLNQHLGIPMLLGDVHSMATEKALSTMERYFHMVMINIKTGEQITWTREQYEILTSKMSITDWRVLLISPITPLKESSKDWTGKRYLWTYAELDM